MVTWQCTGGIEIGRPATVSLSGRPGHGHGLPFIQACPARTADGEPAVHLGLFDVGAERWVDGVATPQQAVAIATAILAQAMVAEERWAAR